ncbi:putative SOS response-associated peptidase YedK [compost metagenome]
MCGRFTQYQGLADYLAALQSEQDIISGYDNVPQGRYNIAPHQVVPLLHADAGGLAFTSLPWRWKPHWAGEGGPPNDFNARRDKVATSKFYRSIWPHRAILFADGWYEWQKDPEVPKIKQPFFIRQANGQPLCIAAIGQFPMQGEGARDDDGFRMITDDAEGGMLDVHDRRPVVLSPEQAREWLDLETSSERAEQLLHEALPEDAFEWYPVGNAVGNWRNNGPELIQPIGGH